MKKRFFGTDGIRGRVGESPITADFALKLGWAVGRVLSGSPRPTVVIGKDTRISGYMFESALEAGLAAAGANIRLLGPMPTPAVAYLTRSLRAAAGIVISASHNAYPDNGFKFFSANGEKLPDESECRIEAALEAAFVTVPAAEVGKAERLEDAPGRYIEYCKDSVSPGFSLAGLKMAVDCAHGACYQVAPRVFRELGAEVVPIGVSPDGLNINQQCGSTQLQAVQAAVRDSGADLGVAFDGDGDRVLMVDGQGEPLDGDELLYIVARSRHQKSAMRGGVVGTLMTNLGFEHALGDLGIPFHRAAVGDRYVHQALCERGWTLGGEASGHLLLLDKASTGDGIVSALEVLEVLVDSGQPLAELRQGMSKYPQLMINVPVAGRVNLAESANLTQGVNRAETDLGSEGRVILRPSGTEPLVRVTVEGKDASRVEHHARALADLVAREFASHD